jgi:8-oxo-dGTP pyrophosphatase MutT (NUDIX family)
MTGLAIKIIQDCLPHYAEEGNQCTSALIEHVTRNVADGARISLETATAFVTLMQRLLDSLALLDRQQLREGRWQFVSFPAQLMANGLICVLADDNQDLLEESYWEQGAHRPEDIIDEQRTLLRTLETSRVRMHQHQSAEPIRFVYVAWGLIRLDGRFLLHHREDKARRQAGNYVLPGGRLNLTDLPIGSQTASVLPHIQRSGSAEALAGLHKTFIREMLEETGLHHQEHYNFRLWRSLKPYREVEGSRNNHAYTEYLIQVFEVVLTDSGQVALFDQLSAYPDRFTWFTVDDLIRKTSADG